MNRYQWLFLYRFWYPLCEFFIFRYRRIKFWLSGQKPGDKRIRITYQVITEESAANGDFEDTGWEDEEGRDMIPDRWDVDEGLTAVDLAVKFLIGEGASEFSCSQFKVDGWYTANGEPDYRTGDETDHSYHLHGFTVEEQKAIYNGVIGELRKRSAA